MTVIVVLGLVVVVIIVVVLVALGMRASRQARDEEEQWMSEEQPQQQQPQQPARSHRGSRGRGGGRAGHADEEPGDGYGAGYDRRVAGAPLGAPLGAPTPTLPRDPVVGPLGQPGNLLDSDQDSGQGLGMSGPSKARDRSTPQPLASRRGRTSEEMEDDDYWATITFDKPKFPWQHDNGQRPQGEDPLAAGAAAYEEEHAAPFTPLTSTGPQPAFGQDVHSGGPATGDNLLGGSRPLTGPYDMPVSAGAGGSRSGSDPLGLPEPFGASAARADSRDRDRDRDLPGMDSPFTGEYALPSTPAQPSTMATQNFSLDSLGSPLSRPAPAAPIPPAPVVPAAPAASSSTPRMSSGSGSGGQDTDGHRLPTVDELLQRIQSDRRRSSEAASDSSSRYGGSDPLNDPLSPSGSSWSSSSTSNSYDSDPLGTSGSRSSGYSGSYDSNYDSNGYRSSSSGYSTDGYPTTPTYGSADPTRYDDPLASPSYGGSSGAGRDPYGSLGGTSEPGSDGGEQPGRYADLNGSYGTSGATDPLGVTRGYPESPGSGGYSGYGSTPTSSGHGSASSGHGPAGYPAEPSYGGAPQPKDYTEPDYGSSPYGSDRQRPANTSGTPDDWDTYRDFRR